MHSDIEMYLKPAKVTFNTPLEMLYPYFRTAVQVVAVFQYSIGDAMQCCGARLW